jgi:hypothetical protein
MAWHLRTQGGNFFVLCLALGLRLLVRLEIIARGNCDFLALVIAQAPHC